LVDGKLKLILGLIWTLILHYSISMPMWEGEDQDPSKRGKNSTPKQKLMDWINSHMPPDLPINNFTTDWNDGRAIGALVDSCAPGLYPEWQNNDPRNKAQNAREAMELAEQWLGIPQVIFAQIVLFNRETTLWFFGFRPEFLFYTLKFCYCDFYLSIFFSLSDLRRWSIRKWTSCP
jgi:hypothetical protein